MTSLRVEAEEALLIGPDLVEISAKLKPASSAARAFSTSAPGSCSSLEMAYPSSTIGPYVPGEDRP